MRIVPQKAVKKTATKLTYGQFADQLMGTQTKYARAKVGQRTGQVKCSPSPVLPVLLACLSARHASLVQGVHKGCPESRAGPSSLD